ncbi:MAG TPA: three-Cys-motif partner protein TcmP [Myxococcota bacterium]|nr:three-Cys-motif partner protein TcmP [Myxococcota bacterium]
MSNVSHSFGGDWTLTKLQILSKYLKAYNVALDGKPSLDRPFRRAFIDAFAGTGYRSVGADLPEDTFRPSIPELEIVDTVRLLDGSARMALMVEPRFDKYIFIEKDRDRCNELSVPGVSRNPAILRNSTNCPMYMFCFAVANPNGVKPAMKIAGDLLKKVERNGTRK